MFSASITLRAETSARTLKPTTIALEAGFHRKSSSNRNYMVLNAFAGKIKLTVYDFVTTMRVDISDTAMIPITIPVPVRMDRVL